jgi:hypothetical protein
MLFKEVSVYAVNRTEPVSTNAELLIVKTTGL